MNRNKIIELARDAGFAMENSAAIQAAERFFALATAHEREACAKVCEGLEHKLRNTSYTPNGFSCANAIRSRSDE
jgi:hypothetical protein